MVIHIWVQYVFFCVSYVFLLPDLFNFCTVFCFILQEDMDQRVMQHFIRQFKKKANIDVSKNDRALSKLRREADKAKRALVVQHTVKVEIENLADGQDFSEELTRAKFEELCMDLFKKTLPPIANVLKDKNLKKTDIHEIVMVGGPSRIPKLQQLVKEFFNGKEPNRGVNPDEAIAYGAAVRIVLLPTLVNYFNQFLFLWPCVFCFAVTGARFHFKWHWWRRNERIIIAGCHTVVVGH